MQALQINHSEKNVILFGPPGTGKTYNSVIYAVSLCEGKRPEDYSSYWQVKRRFKDLKDEGRIVFTTFHQSYGYEEFIEGIKPVISEDQDEDIVNVNYEIVPGIFKNLCKEAKKAKIDNHQFNVEDDAAIWKVTIRDVVWQDCVDNNRVRINKQREEVGAKGFIDAIKKGDIILTTDGSRRRINGIAVVTEDDSITLSEESDNIARNVRWLANNNIHIDNIARYNQGKMLHRRTVARVPNMQVSDVLSMAVKCNDELKDIKIEENRSPYILVIDEINRGNVSKIFGELITLIENSKRIGMKEEASAVLPYSGEAFSVPQNVYIVGTMNTADRSIALIDTALRRRFQFIEMLPEPDVLRELHADKIISGNIELDVAQMLSTINERIQILYDREHMIGHAFFTDLKGSNATIENLGAIFEKSIVPLLQEYFYDDYHKIQLVLGDTVKKDSQKHLKFIQDTRVISKNAFIGFSEDEFNLPEKKYAVNRDAFYDIASYAASFPESC